MTPHFVVSTDSVQNIVDHVDILKDRVMVALRLGMKDAVKALAAAEADAVAGHRRSGLLDRILRNAGHINVTEDSITFIYRPKMHGFQPHYWLEYGVVQPEVVQTYMAMWIEGKVIHRWHRRPFTVPGKPYFFETAEGFRERFYQILVARLEQVAKAA